jgi:galactonate dehydratase
VDRFLLVRVHTSDGLVGNGEAGLWANHDVVARAIEKLAEYYVGKDPARIEHHAQVVGREWHFMGSVLSAATSAIDIALWDILGKSVGRPVHRLLGGRCRDRVRVFANVIGQTPGERAASARSCVEKGYTVLRTTPFFAGWEREKSAGRIISTAVQIVGAIRDEIGLEVDLGLEIHRNLTPEETIVLAGELAPFRILFLEDPIPPENEEALARVARSVSLPLAAAERSYNLFQFAELLGRGILSFLRFDLSLAGGITQCRKIAALAEAHFVRVFPHLMGSPVNTAAYVQLDASIPNYFCQEANEPSEAAREIVEEPLEVVDGYIAVPERPGIGMEINERALSRFPFRPRTVAGNFAADGSVRH